MIVWIEKPLVLLLHDRQLAEHGGMPGVRDNGVLESALVRPQQLYACGEPSPDLADLAASLAHGLAKNHAFVDGNKRTAFVGYRTFLALNDAELKASADEKYTTILALAEGQFSEADFAAWLRSRLHLNAGDASLQEPGAVSAAAVKPRRKKAPPRST